jgi:uncharacterized membrane protein
MRRFLVEYIALVIAAALVLVFVVGEDWPIIAALATTAIVAGVTCARAGYEIAREET